MVQGMIGFMASHVEHRFRMNVSHDGGGVRIDVFGDLDSVAAPELSVEADNAFATSARVVVDLCGASIVDSAALRALIRLHRFAEEQSRRFEIVIGPRYQHVMFDTAGLSEHLHIVSSPPTQSAPPKRVPLATDS